MTRSVTESRASSLLKGLSTVGLVAVLTLIVASCGVNPQPKAYGDDYKDNFILGCTGVDPETGESPEGYEQLASEKQCTCVYDGLVEKVPFDEAKEFEDAQAEAESGSDIEVPDNIAAIFDDCETS